MLLVFLLYRTYGPALVTITGDSFSPIVREGDVVLARRDTRKMDRGAIVLVEAPVELRAPLREIPGRLLESLFRRPPLHRGPGDDRTAVVGRPVIRLILGLPGETVSLEGAEIRVGESGFTTAVLHDELPLRQQAWNLGPDEFFLIALHPGRVDSRVIGPVSRSKILFRVQSIVWPRERRRVLEGISLDSYE